MLLSKHDSDLCPGTTNKETKCSAIHRYMSTTIQKRIKRLWVTEREPEKHGWDAAAEDSHTLKQPWLGSHSSGSDPGWGESRVAGLTGHKIQTGGHPPQMSEKSKQTNNNNPNWHKKTPQRQHLMMKHWDSFFFVGVKCWPSLQPLSSSLNWGHVSWKWSVFLKPDHSFIRL